MYRHNLKSNIILLTIVPLRSTSYLVDVVGVDARVEAHVQAVEHLHHLQGVAGGRDGGEAHDVGKENGNL